MTSIDLVNEYYNDAVKKLKKLSAEKTIFLERQATIDEYTRQMNYHQQNGDTENFDIAQQRRNPLIPARDASAAKLEQYQEEYDSAEALYQEKYNELLNSKQKEELNSLDVNNLEREKSKIEKEEEEKRNEKSKGNEVDKGEEKSNKTLIIIISIVGFLVVTGTILFFVLRNRKKAK